MTEQMQVGIAYLGSPADAGFLAREAEEAGADAFTVGETEHSAFGGAVAALLSTERITVGTNISIAFARSPMAAAMEAYSLVSLGPGRTFYGLGSQIRQVVERRFGAEFANPVGRLEEYVEVMRRAFRSRRGEEGEPVEGRYYSISQFSFFGVPEPELEDVRVHLGAVGPRMTALAARAFDGMLGHGDAKWRHPLRGAGQCADVPGDANEATDVAAGGDRDDLNGHRLPNVTLSLLQGS
jgi:alkanesulfonate monooxygenase SsuD/methylene tetrahydromethanopterin reductase-like flavin-dependent oxidoreductase (luciferase family)